MDIQVDLSWTDCFLWALICLVVPFDWVLSGVGAACFHELCHILAVICLGGRIWSVRIGCRGAVLNALSMEPLAELISILSGPAGSFALLLLMEICPKAALCGFAQGLFNLLPVYPLDGGRALLCLGEVVSAPETAVRICTAVRILISAAFVFLGFMGIYVYKLGFFPVSMLLILFCRTAFGKIPCNADKLGVQ